ncbi:MAG: anthranilate phosphoribosyltransferase [Firmicutes bacterium]|nr:anthranilate phosphoribosyltransferase [Bacillota bacterium]
MLPEVLNKLANKENLTEAEMVQIMTKIMDGELTPTQIGAFLMGLRIKGETSTEITGGARVMRDKAVAINTEDLYAIDTCGTGGDGANTFNISTAVAIITAAAGVPVIKHGNRSVSSRCGSADVLEQLEVKIDLGPNQVKACVSHVNIGFVFAPMFHQAMGNVVKPRKELGVRTIFNVLGPLTNPARVRGQVLGVFAAGLTETLAHALKALGCERALVVHGLDGLDEITITAQTQITELKDGSVETYCIDPPQFGLAYAHKSELAGGDAEANARIITNILQGEKGAKRDIVLLNAAAALYVGKKASGFAEGIELAAEIIDSGVAYQTLASWVKLSREFAVS